MGTPRAIIMRIDVPKDYWYSKQMVIASLVYCFAQCRRPELILVVL